MRKYIIGQAKGGKLVIIHENSFRIFLQENEGKRLKIVVDEIITSKMRAFFEGAVVPFFAFQNEIDGKKLSLLDARETLKLEFNPRYVRRLNGKLEIMGGSTAELNKEKFRLFIEKIIAYMEENGYEIPNSEDYIVWRDSGPMFGEVYPPLKKLMGL